MHELNSEMGDEELVQKYVENTEEFERSLEGLLTRDPKNRRSLRIPYELMRRQYDVNVLKTTTLRFREKNRRCIWFKEETAMDLSTVQGRFEVFVKSSFFEFSISDIANSLRSWLNRETKRELRDERQAERERIAEEKRQQLQEEADERRRERKRREEEKDQRF